ncbi:MAG: hypothetical protein JSW26_01390 [Desulfobacterales bacterium]|nr:MAG: hypothetical protein JSW26_01390 [Desulfobacterales bacterium]
MKLCKIPAIALVLFLALATGAYCGETWTAKLEGRGIVKGGHLPAYGVIETDLDWRFEFDENTGKVQGRVNLVEKLSDGGVRRLKLSGSEVYEVGDPTKRNILFDCDNYEVRVQGIDDQGREIAVHFRSKDNITVPNTIWYWAKAQPDGDYIVNTDAGLSVSNLFWMDCRY